MPPWQLKAAIQGALSLLPEPQRWNRLLQTYVTRSLDLGDDYFVEKWQQALRHVEHAAPRGGVAGARVVEVGTGWFPISPLALVLHGAASVVSVDVNDLLRADKVEATLRSLDRLAAAGRVELPAGARERVAAALAIATDDPRARLASLGVTSMIADARALDLPARSIDLFVSNNVFEHIPRPILVDILREYGRLAAPGAVMSHFVDMADHYALFDRSIGVYNYLRYGERHWRLYNNPLQYQNRLRASDHLAIHREAGWDVIDVDASRRPLDELRRVPLAPEFRGYAEDDLAIYCCWIVSRRAA